MQCFTIQQAIQYIHRYEDIVHQMAKGMLHNPENHNITLYFISCMIPHHQAAIEMCENLQCYTQYPPLQEIAKDIIQMQTKGIAQMREIAKTTQGYTNTVREMNTYAQTYKTIACDMIRKMKNAPRCQNINCNFTKEMIPHHEGAIAMCRNLLQYRIDPRLEQVAKTIIQEQSRGVQQLKEIQKAVCL